MDLATAKVETTANLSMKKPYALTCAAWISTEPLNILDLCSLPEPPSFYEGTRNRRDQILFLREFVHNITQPVAHDGREHIEYVPSQIVTEYFRQRYVHNDGARLNGIAYPSAQLENGKAIVIFVSKADLDPDSWRNRSAPVLTLDPISIQSLER